MSSIKQLLLILIGVLIVHAASQSPGEEKSPDKKKSPLPVAEVLLTPSQQWRTAREELIRIRERLKRFIRKQMEIEKAEHEAKRLRGHASSLAMAQNAGLMSMPPEATPMTFNAPPTTPLRFLQRRSSMQSEVGPPEPLASLENMMSQAINSFGSANMQHQDNSMGHPSLYKAGALLDSFQSPEARALSQSLTQAVVNGRLPIASLIKLASALAPEQTQEAVKSFATQNSPLQLGTNTQPSTITPVIPGDHAGEPPKPSTVDVSPATGSSTDLSNSSDGPIEGGL